MFSYHRSFNMNDLPDESPVSDAGPPSSPSVRNNVIFSNTVWLLLWKNFKLKTRHPCRSMFWMLIPAIFGMIMLLVHWAADRSFVSDATIFRAHNIDDDISLLDFRTKHVLFAPVDNRTRQIMAIFGDATDMNDLIGFDTEKELVDYYMKENTNRIGCAIIFTQLDRDRIEFRIRFPFIPTYFQNDYSMSRLVELTWKTSKKWPKYLKTGPRSPNNSYGGPPDYFNNGFLFVQHEISRAVAIHQDPAIVRLYDQIQIKVQRYPYPPYEKSDFLFYLQLFFPMVFLFSFMSIPFELTKDIVLEKEMRLKEVMKIMGMRNWMYWTSWFLYAFFWNIAFVVILTAILCVPFSGEAILPNSNPIIIFLFGMMYVISIITFCFMMSSLPKVSTKADFASTISGSCYFLMFLPYYFINFNYDDLPFSVRLASALLANIDMPFGLMIITRWENNRVGLQWSNVAEPIADDDPMTFAHVLVMFTVESVLFFLLALYFDAVFPGEYGIGKRWYFPLQPSYWHRRFRSADSDEERKHSITGGINIINLSKSYDGGKNFAVKRLKLNLQPNKITVLLGHNGAGKTTLMSMLCGLTQPTSGSIYFNGINLCREMDEVRKNMGICPQFDVLFDHLTVEEHLWFYCKIKKINDQVIQDEIDTMIMKLDLRAKRHQIAKELSGGMRRKLSVGISLAGGSRFVLLDEATSGMDVSARRFIWDLLISEKRNRTILFSTHFMEEADVLGDKIAILKQGRLQCYGSPYQLRKDFQIGYLLKISVEKFADKQRIIETVKSHVDQAKLLALTNNELTLSLPETQSSRFERLFGEIEQNMHYLGVDNFGVSVSTIEEVFLRANKFPFDEIEPNGHGGPMAASPELVDKIRHNSLRHSNTGQHFCQVFRSQMKKKFKFLIRNRFLLVAHFLIPACVLFLGILSGHGVVDNLTNSPPMPITLKTYERMLVTSFHQNDSKTSQMNGIYRGILSQIPSVTSNEVMAPSNLESTAIQYLIERQQKNYDQINHNYLLSAMFATEQQAFDAAEDDDEGDLTIVAFFNNQVYHSSAISVALVDETLLRYGLNETKLELVIWNDPLPKSGADTINAREFDSVFQTHLLSCLQMAMCFLMASFSFLLVIERCSNFKFIQQISGLKMFQYWLCNFVLDYLFYMLSTLVFALMFYMFNIKAFVSGYHQALMIAMFALNGFASLPCIYLMARLFHDQYTAYVQIILSFFIAGFSTFISVLLLRIGEFRLFHISQQLDDIYTFLFPIYAVTASIFAIYDNHVGLGVCFSPTTFGNVTFNIQDLCRNYKPSQLPAQVLYCCKDYCTFNCFRFNENYWSWETPGIGKYATAMVILSVVFWTTLAILEGRIGKFLRKMSMVMPWHRANKKKWNGGGGPTAYKSIGKSFDGDVVGEEMRIMQHYLEMLITHAMVVKNVSKNYGKLAAVKNISFAVEREECFGMLGQNGAGKTTTFKLITGAEKLTSGDIWINQHNVRDQRSEVFRDIGYCPQFDGLLGELTGRETLEIICRVRGIAEQQIGEQINHLAELLQFTDHIDHVVNSYSGGTKRKLSFAIAIAGNPLVTFLDEPTTGIDPVSRRGLWNAIKLVRSTGSSMVLTSHSMEECEALCNRLVIMVEGRIRCIGSPLHLKRKFGNGHVVQIKLGSRTRQSQQRDMSQSQLRMINACKEIALQKFMERHFPCQFESRYENLYTYRIVSNDIKLSTMFGKIEQAKRRLHIEHYSIDQPSLEKIFLSFANIRQTMAAEAAAAAAAAPEVVCDAVQSPAAEEQEQELSSSSSPAELIRIQPISDDDYV